MPKDIPDIMDGFVEDKPQSLMQHPSQQQGQLPSISPFVEGLNKQAGAAASGTLQGLKNIPNMEYGGAVNAPFLGPVQKVSNQLEPVPGSQHEEKGFFGEPFQTSKFRPQQDVMSNVKEGRENETGQPPENWQANLVNQLRKLPFVSAAESLFNPKSDTERAYTGGELFGGVAPFAGAEFIGDKSQSIIHPPESVLHEKISKNLTNALSPGKTNQNWSSSLKNILKSGDLASAIQDAKAIDPITGQPTNEPLDIKSHGDYYDALHQRLAKFWEDEAKPRLATVKDLNVNKSEVLKNMNVVKSGIDAKIEPVAYGKSGGEAAEFYSNDEPMNFDESQTRQATLNKRLNSFFKAPITTSEIESTAPKIAANLAELESLKEQQNKAIENLTGQGMSEFKKRYSDLKTHEEQAFRAKVASEVKKSPGLSKALTPYMGGKLLLGLGAMLSGHAQLGAGALGLGASEAAMRFGMSETGTNPDYNLRKAVDAIKKLPKARTSVITQPTEQLPTVQPPIVPQEPPAGPKPAFSYDPSSKQASFGVQPFKPSVARPESALHMSPTGEVMFTPKGQAAPEINRPIPKEVEQIPPVQQFQPQLSGQQQPQLNRGPLFTPQGQPFEEPQKESIVTPYKEQKLLKSPTDIITPAPKEQKQLGTSLQEYEGGYTKTIENKENKLKASIKKKRKSTKN